MTILPILIVIILLLFLGSGSVDAQGAGDHNEGNWPDQFELFIFVPAPNHEFRADGLEEAKMYIAIINKATNLPDRAQSDVEVWLSSENGQSILEPQMVTISEGEGRSKDISLRSKKAGTVTVTAVPVGIGFNTTSTTVKFVSPSEPSALFLEAYPKENIPADGKHSVKLTVKLLYPPDNEPYPPPKNTSIDTWTDKGDPGPQIIIAKDTRYGQGEFTTYKGGMVNITARSPDFRLEAGTEVTFVTIFALLTLLLAAVGGILGGVVKYYQEIQEKKLKEIVVIPTRKDPGLIGYLAVHALSGFIVYMGAIFDMPLTNPFKLPLDVGSGALMIGLTGGLYFFAILSVWDYRYNILDKLKRGGKK